MMAMVLDQEAYPAHEGRSLFFILSEGDGDDELALWNVLLFDWRMSFTSHQNGFFRDFLISDINYGIIWSNST